MTLRAIFAKPIAGCVIQRICIPRLLIETASYDVASDACQALRSGPEAPPVVYHSADDSPGSDSLLVIFPTARLGGAVQVDPIKPTLKPPGIKLLTRKHDEPLSNFAFKFNLRRYNWGFGSRRTQRSLGRRGPGQGLALVPISAQLERTLPSHDPN